MTNPITMFAVLIVETDIAPQCEGKMLRWQKTGESTITTQLGISICDRVFPAVALKHR